MSAEQTDPRFRPIPRERVADRVAQELLKLIRAGTLSPGERLPGERHLAEMMNVSRVSVRAALQQLKDEGYVVALQGGGTRVISTVDQQDTPLVRLVSADVGNLRDLAEIRDNVEVWAARRAAERADDADIAAIENALATMADCAVDPAERAEADHAFHMAIGKAAKSPVYTHMLDMLGGVFGRSIGYHRSALQAEDARQNLVEQHRRILDAIRRGDADEAAAAMHDHLQSMLTLFGPQGAVADDRDDEAPAAQPYR
ncbi:transcriptional regulator, GntR family [Limimonas halophila]|uniref:Transcriptional regulator, GntR family n=1 Tax=Limimonas halophila TaxID=1082479 RepID=A0A1G7QUS5_9PROT|nr:FadR/GntR family transcriptional regulator [Limimonas halophila]SDG02262.1 transcriptional regulator, GntR family [Limimonas halophila]